MSDGRGGLKRTALWVNWGNNWNEPSWGAWWVTHDGVMHVKEIPRFYREILIRGERFDASGVRKANQAVVSNRDDGYFTIEKIAYRNRGSGGSQVGFYTGNTWMWITIDDIT